ncbi:uncharacterized protein LOC131161015 [Malania oleifera]|uniref:uncharacterized protein LOC131161015 n=1 Tax=Malania oleifera TaxID=397392 RepID=UPI0025AE3513|nr:uncharacterized protein LOC131161015 [Malania oleifera]
MGDIRDWLPEPNGALIEERPVPLSSALSLSPNPSPNPNPNPNANPNPSPASIGAERWRVAEQATQGIICQVQPTVVSEVRRRAVIDYVQRLLRVYVGCEVFPFGSVPLKTYLPDGDIDLTAFGVPNVEDALASDVSSVLEGEDQNSDAEFVVKDVQIINAEVKLVKCLVQNIVVDISFNQLGGLCTLCFLEQVDCLIGKDHLFKRSIILIKAWCYYESRILGAHHGLISTYALETLVLYIFHLFHSSLNGPLAVLYRFLDYFSKFDWDNYCISVNGPVRISSLPEIVAERPDNGGLDLLLTKDFLRECVDMFSVPSRVHETSSRTFLQKHLNIVDPLKENNNLGRSVSKGNFYRIRSAFTYGARKLGRILLQPEENIADELQKFFMNTLDRHGSGQRPDVQDPLPMSGFNGFGPATSIEACQEDKTLSISKFADSGGTTREYRFAPEGLLQNGVDDNRMSLMKMKVSKTFNELQKGSKEVLPSTVWSEADYFANGTAVSGCRLSGDAKDLATSRVRSLGISDDAPKYSPLGGEESISLLGKAHHAPHLYFSPSLMGDAKLSNGNPDYKQEESSDDAYNKASSDLRQMPYEKTGVLVSCELDENQLVRNNEFLTSAGSIDSPPILSPVACSPKDLYHGQQDRASVGTLATSEALNSISDLSGEYDAHFNSLQYGRWCHEYAVGAPVSPMSLPMPSQFHSKNSWNSMQRPPQFRRGVFSRMNTNGIVPRPAFYPLTLPMIPGSAYGMEELPKPRGTGTYFPNTNHQFSRPRFSSARGRNHVPVRSPRNNSRAATPPEENLLDRSSREVPQAQFLVHQGSGNFGSSDFYHSLSPGRNDHPSPNGLLLSTEKLVEFGSISKLQLGPPPIGSSRLPNPGTSSTQNSSLSPSTPGTQRTKPVLGTLEDRIAARSYRLKDEDDFPPLSA